MQKVSVVYKGITVTSEIGVNIRISSDGNLYVEDEQVESGVTPFWPKPRNTVTPTPSPAKKGSMREYVTNHFPEVGVVKTIKGNVKTIYGAFMNNGWKPSVKYLKSGSYRVKRVL